MESHPTPFSSLDDYVALPRVEGLALSPDGQRVVLTVATLTRDQTSYERALWSVAADGTGVPTRLTRSAKGESGAAFTADGDVLFVSTRLDAAADKGADTDAVAAQLWLLPVAGGEARAITRLAGGVSGIAAVASSSSNLVIAAELLPSAADLEAEGAARKERTEKKVAAILHESYPVRFWDHDLGPAEPHLLALDLADLQDTIAPPASASDTVSEADTPAPYPADLPRPRDLTPAPGRTMDTAGHANRRRAGC
jgi:dipeptidyl aminopeptidase/acylaminoacyl peptidase